MQWNRFDIPICLWLIDSEPSLNKIGLIFYIHLFMEYNIKYITDITMSRVKAS